MAHIIEEYHPLSRIITRHDARGARRLNARGAHHQRIGCSGEKSCAYPLQRRAWHQRVK